MKFRRKLVPKANVDLIPMIDVVFQLVIFFMVSTTFLITPGIPIIFPTSTTAEPVAMTKLVVTVVSERELYVADKKYSLETLDAALAKTVTVEEIDRKGAIIEGNANVSYSLMISVLDVLRKNGFKVANLKTKTDKE
ncbi:MAG: biopolymer transporter ExbD [Spirochaetales bacterium]|nr:biopolymer transporter ExbD [Spirochaetales bacterium]